MGSSEIDGGGDHNDKYTKYSIYRLVEVTTAHIDGDGDGCSCGQGGIGVHDGSQW